MPSYTLELELLGVYSVDMPGFEIWTDGTIEGTPYSISSAGTSISITVSYGGALPTSLEFRFNDASGEGGRTVEIQSVKINDKYVNVGNYLSSNSLVNGGNATVDVANSSFFYDSSEPSAGTFTPVTTALTAMLDNHRDFSGGDLILDGLAGNDRIFVGSGNDTITGGAGDDFIRGGAGNDLLYGAADNDRIFGEAGDDLIYGGIGNDTIQGGADNDEIHGNNGNDRLHGNAGDDVITGGAGDDVITGGTGTNYLFGDAGDDQIIGDSGVDTIDGGDDDDILYGGGSDDFLNGGDGNDILVGDTGDDILNGDDGDDVLNGRADNDILNGGAGNDILSGEDGIDVLNGGSNDDVLIGGDGTDILDGGAGNDILHGSGLTGTEIFTILQANPNIVFNVETNSFYEYVAGPTNWITAQANAASSTINGVGGHLVNITTQAENDLIYQMGLDNGTSNAIGAGGNRIWLGGSDVVSDQDWVWENGAEAGIQFSNASASTNNMYQNWGGGQPNNSGGAQVYATMWFNGGGDDDTWDDRNASDGHNYVIEWNAGLLSDDLAIDTLNGGDGNDTLYGYGGADILNGDNGNDILIGGAGNDTLDGGRGDDAIFGGDGNDTLDGGGVDNGDDVFDGGAGTDWADFGSYNTWADVDLTIVGQQNTRRGDDTFISIENLRGSDFQDDLAGDTNVNIIEGGLGNDEIWGNGGADTLRGQDGNDDFWVSGTDAYDDIFDGGADFDEIQLSADAFFNLAITYIDVERIDMNGNRAIALLNDGFDFTGMVVTARGNMEGQGGNESITGSDSNDLIYGLAGNDILNGGLGNDQIWGGDDVDTISGNDGDDIIRGEAGADILNGNAGNDDFYLSGTEGLGDQYDGGADFDEIRLEAATTLNLAATFINMERVVFGGFDITAVSGDGFDLSGMARTGAGNLLGQAGNETITGTDGGDTIYGFAGTDTLNGSAGNDTIYGGDDNDIINGGAGADILYGEAGADTINGGDDNDNIYVSGTDSLGDQYDGGAGTNYLRLEADSYFNSANTFTNLTQIRTNGFHLIAALNDGFDLTGQIRQGSGQLHGQGGTETIIGSDNADTIYGFAGNDVLNGGDGNDTIYGGDDVDTISGGTGNDIIRGEAGADILNGNDGNDDFYINGSDGIGDQYDGGNDSDDIRLESAITLDLTTTFVNMERVVFGGFSVTASLNSGFDLSGMNRNGAGDLLGQGGNETITGTEGGDNIYGLEGADILNGAGGNDNFYISGTESLGDQYDGGAGTDDEIIMTADSQFNSANSFTGIEQFLFGGFNALVVSGATVDFSGMVRVNAGEIHGDSGNETITGMDNRDYLYGFAGDDVLRGGGGNDFIYGGADDDVIYGGDGRDDLYGEGGSDIFVLENATAFNDIERIRDFSATDSDALDIQDLLFNYTFGVDDLTQFVQVLNSGANTNVFVDTAGSGTFGAGTQVATVFGVNTAEDEIALETAGYLITH